MTRDLGTMLRMGRWAAALLVMLATVASVSSASASGSYTITTLKTTQGKVLFSLRPISVSFSTSSGSALTSTGGSLPVKYASKSSVSTMAAKYKLTTVSKPLLTSIAAGRYYTLVYKVMSGTPAACVLKEQLTGAWIIKAQMSYVATAGIQYPTDVLTFVYASVKRVSC